MKQIGELTGTAPAPTFDMWWGIYPRKQQKAKAEAKFKKLPVEKQAACYLGTLRQVESNPQWRNPKFVPMPMTFLNQERWADEIVENKGAVERATDEAKETQSKHDFVWAALSQMYGETFTNKFGEKPPEIWRKMLATIEWPRLKRGLRLALNSGNEFAPSLPKFMEYCAKTFGEQTAQKALPSSPKTDTETALKHLAEARKILEKNRG